jgi:hypothetical protein
VNVPGIEPGAFSAAVRREYFKLPRDLAVLTRSFGIILPLELQRDAAVLTFAIECADRLLDSIPLADRRARFRADVLSCLRRQTFSNEDLTLELVGWLGRLRKVGERRNIHERLCQMADELLDNSECMRTARDHRQFVECALKEGRLMVGMLLLILAGVSTARFDSFMRLLSEPANLGDKLRDARADFRSGEISVEPTWRFHARLSYEFLKRTARLAPFSLLNWRLAGWGVRSLFSELIWFA